MITGMHSFICAFALLFISMEKTNIPQNSISTFAMKVQFQIQIAFANLSAETD